jgi:dynein heavy chain
MWGVGALLELEDRAKMQEFLMGREGLDLPTLAEDSKETIFEYVVDKNGSYFLVNSLILILLFVLSDCLTI